MNDGMVVDYCPVTGERLCKVSAPVFLLIQGRNILDYNLSPVCLTWALADKQQNIIVAVGITNEFNQKEIVGICAEYRYTPFCKHWVVTVDDGIPQEIDITGKPGIVLRDYLYKLKAQGKLTDPVNFSRVILRAEV